MQQLFWVGLGGFLGAILRFIISGSVSWISNGILLPSGTLIVNLGGSFIFGALSVFAENSKWFNGELKAFVFIGALGAFTTFSTFANESFSLFQQGSNFWAILNIGFHIFLGLVSIWLGRILGAALLS